MQQSNKSVESFFLLLYILYRNLNRDLARSRS